MEKDQPNLSFNLKKVQEFLKNEYSDIESSKAPSDEFRPIPIAKTRTNVLYINLKK